MLKLVESLKENLHSAELTLKSLKLFMILSGGRFERLRSKVAISAAREHAMRSGPVSNVGPDILKKGNCCGRTGPMWASSSNVK